MRMYMNQSNLSLGKLLHYEDVSKLLKNFLVCIKIHFKKTMLTNLVDRLQWDSEKDTINIDLDMISCW